MLNITTIENKVLQSSFVSWCTECIADFGYNATTFDADAHTAASNAAHFVANDGDITWTIIAIASILIGLLMTFVGYEGFYLTLGLLAFVTGSTISFGLLCGATHSAIAAIVVGIVCGILASVLVVKLERLGAALCGAIGGVIGYMYLNGFLLTHLYNALPEAHQSYTPVLIVIAMAVVGAVLAVILERHAIIVSTSLGGAYAIGWAADRLAFKSANHNLNPLVLVSGGGCHSWECYLILAGIVVVACIGIVVQERRTSEDEVESARDSEGRVLRRFSKARKNGDYAAAYIVYDGESQEGTMALQSSKARRVSRELIV